MTARARPIASVSLIAVAAGAVFAIRGSAFADPSLLNVSYDPTRALYQQLNAAFAKRWKEKTGENVRFRQSHGGSGKQARAVLEGLAADIVTLALAYDIDAIAQRSKLLPSTWQSRLPYGSAPYASTIVFVVRKGNPKRIRDWEDLTREGVAVITPNPKTSGGARWSYMAAWGYALRKHGGDEGKAEELVTRIYKNVAVLDSGARGAATTFAERRIGDVLVAWENEAYLLTKGLGGDRFEIVFPSASILAEPPVSIVDRNVDKHGTRVLAEAFLEFLYTDEAQEIAARHFFRPRSEGIRLKYSTAFRALELFTIADMGGWKVAQRKHFDDDGTFDRIYRED